MSWKKWIVTLGLICGIATGAVFGSFQGLDEKYTLFDKLDSSHSNQLIQIVKNAQARINDNISLLCSAIKRIRDLKLVEAKKAVKDVLLTYFAGDGNVNAVKSKDFRDAYYLAIQTLGALSQSEDDAALLYTYYQASRDYTEYYLVIEALGNMTNSQIAITSLNEMTDSLTERSSRLKYNRELVETLMTAIEKHNKKSSANLVFKASKQFKYNKELYNRMNELFKTLSEKGRD